MMQKTAQNWVAHQEGRAVALSSGCRVELVAFNKCWCLDTWSLPLEFLLQLVCLGSQKCIFFLKPLRWFYGAARADKHYARETEVKVRIMQTRKGGEKLGSRIDLKGNNLEDRTGTRVRQGMHLGRQNLWRRVSPYILYLRHLPCLTLEPVLPGNMLEA